MDNLYILAAGFLLDLMFGDPHWMPHPVVFIGKLISRAERHLRPLFPATKDGERMAGGILVALVLLITWLVFFGISHILYAIYPVLGTIYGIFLTYQVLATKCLATEARKVQGVLMGGKLEEARVAVGYLVGRDTENLSAQGVTKATVETVAENTVDGVVAPLLFMAIGGPVLGIIYKAVNTMDSMIGYKNDKYQYFGTVAARLDDVCNYLPSRITALFMVVAACLLSMDGKGAFRVWRRDRRNHKSPNSAQTESVCAGALNVQLAGDSVYFGKVVKKPFIGDNIRDIASDDIEKACKLMVTTAWIGLFVALFCLGGFWAIFG